MKFGVIVTLVLSCCRFAFCGGLQLSPLLQELPPFPDNECRRVELTLQNSGNRPVQIRRVVSSCPCLAIKEFPETVPPGEKRKIFAEFVPFASQGQFSRQISVFSDAEDGGFLVAEIRGEAVGAFWVRCDLPTVLRDPEPGSVWTGRYEVVASSPDYRLGRITSKDIGGVTCETIVSTNALQPLASYTVERRVRFSDAQVQSHTLFFEILDSNGNKILRPPLGLDVEAICDPGLTFVPSQVTLSKTAGSAVRSLNLFLRVGETADGIPEYESPVPGVTVAFEPLTGKRGWRVKLEFSPVATGYIATHPGSELIFRYRGHNVKLPLK